MTDRRESRRLLLLLASAAMLLPLGCGRPTAIVKFTSYKDPHFPEVYQVELEQCAYYVGPGGDYHIVGSATHIPEDGSTGTIAQLLHLHMFWKPWPGKTFDDSSSVDATIRYAIVTERGAAMYCGTGFVYPRKRRMSDDVVVEIEVGRLRLASRKGDPPELLGTARLTGTLVADNDASLAVDLRRRLDLHAGACEPE